MAEPRTTPREWALATGGGLALCAIMVWWWQGDEPAPAPAKPPLVPLMVPPPVQALPTAPDLDLSGLVLRGVLLRRGSPAAIIETPDGRQRLVQQDGLVMPGVRLASVMPGGVELEAGGTGRHRLDMDPGASAAMPLRAGLVRTARPQDVAASVNAWRLGLMAVRDDTGRITGWRVRDTRQLPLLEMAGLAPGDMLLAVNGQELFSEEKVMDLPGEVAGAHAVTLDYLRNGRAGQTKINLER